MNEQDKAAVANPTEEITIFHKILAKEIPSTKVYEDDYVYAFNDINPQAPVHIVIIPKKLDGLTQLSKAEERHVETLGRLLYAAKVVAKQEKLDEGFRTVINDGVNGCKSILLNVFTKLGQSVYYLHLHVLGGAKFGWPPGTNF